MREPDYHMAHKISYQMAIPLFSYQQRYHYSAIHPTTLSPSSQECTLVHFSLPVWQGNVIEYNTEKRSQADGGNHPVAAQPVDQSDVIETNGGHQTESETEEEVEAASNKL